ncbi:hypothetical protein D3C87_1862210 [compost metagenome]
MAARAVGVIDRLRQFALARAETLVRKGQLRQRAIACLPVGQFRLRPVQELLAGLHEEGFKRLRSEVLLNRVLVLADDVEIDHRDLQPRQPQLAA